MLTKNDVTQIEAYGLSIPSILFQIETLSKGVPFTNVLTAASINNGIFKMNEDEQNSLASYYDTRKDTLEIVKFVPASGAATRMFKFLHQFLTTYNPNEEKLNAYLKEGDTSALDQFFSQIDDLPFIAVLRKKIRERYPDYKKNSKGARMMMLVKTILEEEGLNYSNLPKGLIPFHKYTKYTTTPFEEQLLEAAYYGSVKNDVHLHFTFSENHVEKFKEEYNAVKKRVSKKTKKEFHVTYSFQKKETDALVVTSDNTPVRDANKNLLFKPSGHGALIKNLDDVNADVIFIKNIDNVTVENDVEALAHYKKLLAGKLLKVQDGIFHYLRLLKQGEVSKELMGEITSFLWKEINHKDRIETQEEMFAILNRPIRVCGVVKNTGAPGGGPFWVKNQIGKTSLQIVELSQIDTQNTHQKTIVEEATHFNPVDVVCGVRDFEGNKFKLEEFVDKNTGFIAHKTYNGKPVKALELPGLWNGAMANWNTIFVEVPIATFNPVKTVNDLFKKEHRPNA